MKILKLRFKNLNSLYGEWFIDFTDPEYVSNGIFALTGPTGAGKSTILDAICLALYGATPRLGKITKSRNDIMSRQTGECFAEVIFESQEGRFCCHWCQHRARKKAGKALQDTRHEISDAFTGKPLETKKSIVAKIIEEKTGMDFERFTRSILLAQGGFDSFLKADVEQKSKILEQITGTEIYTEISRRVHERYRDEREKLNILQASISGIVILEADQELTINNELGEKLKKETQLADRISEIGKAIAWLTGIGCLKTEINALAEESDLLRSELELFKPDRERLVRAQKAAELEGQFAIVSSTRKQQNTDQQSLATEVCKLPDLESMVQQKEISLRKTEQMILKVKEDQKNAAPLLQKVRTLDQQLVDKKKIINSGEGDCKKVTQQITADKKLLDKEKKKIESEQNNLKLVSKYLESNVRDEWLVGELAGIGEKLGNLLLVQAQISEKKEAENKNQEYLKITHKKVLVCTGELNKRKKELQDTRNSLELNNNELKILLADRLLREYRTEKETLLREMAFLSKIADFESERSKLKDGNPCPLCGSEGHPFAMENIPEPDEIEKKIEMLSQLIHKADQLETSIKQLENAEKKALEKVTDCEKLESEAVNDKKNTEKILTDLFLDLKKTGERFVELKKSALKKLQPLEIVVIPDNDVSSLLELLKQRLKTWQEHLKKNAEIEKLVIELNTEFNRISAVIETHSKVLREKQTALDVMKQEFEVGNSRRKELFESRNVDSEEIRLTKRINDAELVEKKSRIVCDEAKQQLNSVKVNIASLKDRIDKRKLELKQLEAEFVSNRQALGFVDEQLFVEERLSLPERDKLIATAKKLDDQQTALLARYKDRKDRLVIEINKKVTDSQLEELQVVCKEFEESIKNLRDEIAGLKHKLVENNIAKKRIKEKQSAIDFQKNESTRWDKLYGLIGSSDGKKYRNFAQGLTFELMVSHANLQLEKMTDRYLLIRDDEQPLDLNVVDNYQAGEIRSTNNLSGGESFIVSLTLALGLSQMASRKIRVDSLFLDEGFGTLDEDALETALETLSGLQQDGKLIGIISHVSALKERISTQISINPVSGGKSNITGPGCKWLN